VFEPTGGAAGLLNTPSVAFLAFQIEDGANWLKTAHDLAWLLPPLYLS
jgi:hypothetical protein